MHFFSCMKIKGQKKVDRLCSLLELHLSPSPCKNKKAPMKVENKRVYFVIIKE